MIDRLERGLSLMIKSRPYAARNREAVVSFTFDDFPSSALKVGGNLLEKAGFQATYYTVSNLMGTKQKNIPLASSEDVKAAHRSGHEIACHTLDHVNCQLQSRDSLHQQLALNRERLADLTGTPPVSFSYPFGLLNFSAKAEAMRIYSSARTIYYGFNLRTLDLSALRAVRIYSHSFDESLIGQLLDKAVRKRGWVIFYTHDVSEQPSKVGCTPKHLETVADMVHHRNITTLPIRHALGLISFKPYTQRNYAS